jgi:S-adenosylmethionine/arginine decarboxylase-like enzyme
MTTNTYWGYHMIVDAADCDRAAITSAENIANFAKHLVKEIDMIAYGEPQVVHFGEDNKAGYTLVQLISTSCVSAHFCDHSGDCYLDIFSCKPYDIRVAEQVFSDYFKPTRMRVNYITRQA